MSRVAVEVLIPSMLHAVVGSKRLRVEAATLAEAVEAAFRAVPALRFHLCEDDGRFRPHVLCFLNDCNTRDMKNLNVPLNTGDEVAFVAAISGGAVIREPGRKWRVPAGSASVPCGTGRQGA